MGRRPIDLTGMHFGRLTVLGEARRVSWADGVMWLCRCDCGTEKTVSSNALRGGGTQSCGCLRAEILRRAPKLRAPKPESGSEIER